VNFARGSTIDNAIILISEAENFSKEEMLLLLTRIGENSKIILTGDLEQLDRKDIIKSKNKCGLEFAVEKLSTLSSVGVIEFNNDDIVRNPLIGEIIDLWKK
jgi:phosphate starvation-inducible PhoH-like protein